MVAKGKPIVTKDKQWWTFEVLKLSITQNGYELKICIKLQIPYYHPLIQWLLGATNGNQGQAVMDPWSSETTNQL